MNNCADFSIVRILELRSHRIGLLSTRQVFLHLPAISRRQAFPSLKFNSPQTPLLE